MTIFRLAALCALLAADAGGAAPQQPGEAQPTAGDLAAELRELRRQFGGLTLELRKREELLEGLKRDLAGFGEQLGELRERGASPAAPFLAGPPPSTDTVGVARVAVFAPRVAVDSSRRHDSVSLRVKRVEPGGLRVVAEVELGRDELDVDLPLDQNGALYVVDWATSEGHTYSLLLRDGAGGPEASGQPAATAQVKPLQAQGRFIFVGYRVE